MADESTLAATTPDSSLVNPAVDPAAAPAPEPGAEVKTDAANAAAEPKSEEAKGAEASKTDVKPEVPEAYEFKAPDGTTLDEGAIALVTPVLKELGVTQEGAQKLTDAFIQIQAAQATAQSEAWLTAAKSDPQIGGKEFEANAKLAQEAFAKFGSPELKAFIDQTGLGNHPELLKTFVKIAKASAQDTHVQASAQAPELTPAQRMFPNTK